MSTETGRKPAEWVDGDPLMEAIAAAVYEHCERHDSGLVIDDPRNIAAVVASTARTTVLREAATRLHELRMAEREWLPATGLHKGEQELRRMAGDAQRSDSNGWPGDEHAEPGTRGWTA